MDGLDRNLGKIEDRPTDPNLEVYRPHDMHVSCKHM